MTSAPPAREHKADLKAATGMSVIDPKRKSGSSRGGRASLLRRATTLVSCLNKDTGGAADRIRKQHGR
jgi:hypothetical protein